MTKLLLTHPGTQYSYGLAAQLQQLGLLGRFATCIGFGEGQRIGSNLLPSRAIKGVPDSKVSRIMLPELTALLSRKLRPKSEQAILCKRNERFQQAIPSDWLAQADGVIGFDTSSWILAARCREMGLPFFLDVSIPHPVVKEYWYARLRNEFPDWAEHLPAKPKWMLDNEATEMALADQLVVATSFTKNTLVQQGVDPLRIAINPYGTNLNFFSSKWEGQQKTTDKAVRFVFMGKIGARKGIPWLLRVWPRFLENHPHSTLMLAGDGSLPAGVKLPRGVSIRGFVPVNERADFLRQYDVFVFPSYFEGFGQVMLEAMACGLPVIATTHTAAPEIMTDAEGCLVEPGNDQQLLEALCRFGEDPTSIKKMGEAAALGAQAFSWEAYGLRWQQIISQVAAQRPSSAKK